ncbi:MAG: SDR family oxidoreductase [Gemmatimonadetes bacterium]|nr:SDR family oxidoreductase [Gemmatimonadota bacterium]
MSDLAGRVALVTGGGRGIGAAVARALADAGASVAVAARTGAEVETVAEELRASGVRAAAVVADVTDEASVAAMLREVDAELGAVDVLVNNAGTATAAPVHRLTLADWNRLLAVNATGVFLCTREALPGMRRRGWGRVVTVASVAGLHGDRYISAYAASKHAVLGFTRSVALEVAGEGVTVNAVCPGYVDTPLTLRSAERIAERTGRTVDDGLAWMAARSPLGRLIRPGEVAHAVVSLCHEEAGAVNGEALVVDGGATFSA